MLSPLKYFRIIKKYASLDVALLVCEYLDYTNCHKIYMCHYFAKGQFDHFYIFENVISKRDLGKRIVDERVNHRVGTHITKHIIEYVSKFDININTLSEAKMCIEQHNLYESLVDVFILMNENREFCFRTEVSFCKKVPDYI